MCPDKAKVFVMEDSERWQSSIKEELERAGHQVALTAQTRDEALAGVRRLRELGVKVATIDGNLSEWDTSGKDGKEVLKAIKASAPEVKTIGMSGFNIDGVDVNVTKLHFENLAKAVTDI